MSGTTKTVAERLREAESLCETKAICKVIMHAINGEVICPPTSCGKCRKGVLKTLVSQIEAEQAELRDENERLRKDFYEPLAKMGFTEHAHGLEVTYNKAFEELQRLKEKPSGVDVDALLKVADEISELVDIPPYNVNAVALSTARNWKYRIRDAVKGANASKPMPLDVDGEPCFLDDAVWHKGKKHLVVAVSHKGKVCIRDWETRDSGEGAVWVKAERVTHCKPDTLESVIAEMLADLDGSDSIELDGYFDRLRKLLGGD